MEDLLETIYPKCRALVDPDVRPELERILNSDTSSENCYSDLLRLSKSGNVPAYLPDLGRIEAGLNRVKTRTDGDTGHLERICVNPGLEILEVSWTGLASFFASGVEVSNPAPVAGAERLLLWRDPETGHALISKASDADLLVLKIVIEGLDPVEIARENAIPVGMLDRAVDRAVSRGLLLRPTSMIRRPFSHFRANRALEKDYASSPVFTLQWHVTQACDLHCKHCYDRSDRSPLKLGHAISILEDLREFCRSRFVRGQISFTGGNPLLYSHFDELYRAAAENGFSTAILGNPTTRRRLEGLIRIQPPVFFQVSLEGLREHNDDIRGPGHFDRTMSFLEILKDLNIYSMVMLTLTRENMREVLPLSEVLCGKVDYFTFNRLSMVGEGADLRLPAVDDYAAFLRKYIEASGENPIMGLKDNLINILHHREDVPLTGGCTGFGCGAAFNFITLLPDGEVHACRKFPSCIGNIFEKSFSELYESEPARRYRSGSRACGDCAIRPVCGGCLATTYGHGLDVFEDRDPMCFMGKAVTSET